MDFESTYIGQKRKLGRLVSATDVDAFIVLTGDTNRLHIHDGHYGSIKTPVVHGMLTASFISTVIGTMLPGGGALWKSSSLKFIKPVYVGDSITVVVEVMKRNISERELVLKTDVFNQNNDIVILGTAIVKLLEI
jgi:3-oxoacyl-[acyl-carrier protein] reductase